METVADRWLALGAILGDAGFDQLNYAVLNTAQQDRATASVTQFSTMDSSWIEHYLDRRLDLHDPHVRFVREMGWKPYFFDHTTLGGLSSEERQVIEQAAEAGLRAQISVVFPKSMGECGPNGGMTIGSSRNPADFYRSVAGQEDMLLTVAMLFHSLSIGDVRREQMGAQVLTRRERDTLSYLARGLRVQRTADKLGISEATVELHLRNARRKLKARTTAQAIAHAVLLGDVAL